MTTNHQLKGILAAVVTPMHDDGTVDEAGIARQVDHILGQGIHGLVPGGSTGEFTTLTTEERKRSNKAYIQAAQGRGVVYAGTGALGTRETIELSVDAEKAGADGLMIAPPFYDAPPWEELLAHFEAVSEAVSIPIMYYNLPGNTGVELSAEQLAELGRRTGVTCYKDTGGDAVKFDDVLLNHSEDIQPLNGYDTLSFAALAHGAQAAVWGTASVIPQLCAEFYETLAVRADLETARAQWERIQPICVFLESHNYAAAIKTGLELVGQGAGPTRAPVRPLAPEYREEFGRLLQEAGAQSAQG